jgi:DNA-binding NtrC family response regulator
MDAHFDPQKIIGLSTIQKSSRAMRELFQTVERFAQSNAAILLRGETGCGKELIARAIHHFSLRCNKPWIDVNCAALPEHLMESELFGFEKGAFSGADHMKPGLFELADKGTLFLDEIAELVPRMQVKLLRVLDGVPFYRLGGTKKVAVNVRVIAATNQPLEQDIGNGEFRRDLYHRLAQIEIRIPPLRERREDVVPLAQLALDAEHPGRTFSADAVSALLAYSWPGNVRELRNVVMRAGLLTMSQQITAEHLGLAVSAPAPPKIEPISSSIPLEELERRAIEQAMTETDGHHQRAALLLGISRRTLARKLKQYAGEASEQLQRVLVGSGSD